MSKYYYDKHATYSLAPFHNHELQDIMALFLLNPALYSDYKTTRDKQGYFFSTFRSFADNYYHFSETKDLDLRIYFMSQAKERAGEANICGGSGRISNAAKKEFKSKYHGAETNRAEMIDYFQAKYRVAKDPSNRDVRLFLGVTEIWNKLDQAAEIIASSRWADVLSRSYSDETCTNPIPNGLEKHLIPHAIRNRVWQKHLNSKRTCVNSYFAKPRKDEEDEEEYAFSNESKSSPPLPATAKFLVTIPSGADDDW